MNETEIKTRLGLILEAVVEAALAKQGLSFEQDVQYDPTCEKPDFLLPDSKTPSIMVEVHQTEARNSFQMKTLRAFTAVTEAKAFFGNDLVSVNILFGDPANELPPANVKAMCGIFDINLVPRDDVTDKVEIARMEADALKMAQTDGLTTDQAGCDLVKVHPKAVKTLADLWKLKVTPAKARKELNAVWNLERTRAKSIGPSPISGDSTYYKRSMLRALYLNDLDFAELFEKKDLSLCSQALRNQIVRTKIGTVSEECDGDHYTLCSVFSAFLGDPQAPTLRNTCKEVLDAEPRMKWFFEDIRDKERRIQMATTFLDAWSLGISNLRNLLFDSFIGDTVNEIEHRRCWVADLLPLIVGRSHNAFNNLVKNHSSYPTKLGNPYNNIVIKSPRLGNDVGIRQTYLEIAWEVFEKISTSEAIKPEGFSIPAVEEMLLKFRYSAAIKLQKLDPLFLTAEGISSALGIDMIELTVPSLVGDLAGESQAGEFMTYAFRSQLTGKTVLANAVAVHEGNGDHKSKEWGARRLATLYRIDNEGVRPSEYPEAIFVIDGEWTDKDVARLHRSGWNHVVRLSDLEATLRQVFGIKQTQKLKPISSLKIALGDLEEDLPIAAETKSETPKLKRKGGQR